MFDTQLLTAVRAVILAGLAAQGLEEIQVKQDRPPAAAIGADTGPTIYLDKLFDTNQGQMKRETAPDPDDLAGIVQTDTQWLGTSLQATAVFEQSQDGTGFTASDIANIARATLQSTPALAALRAAGLGVLRVDQIRNMKIINGAGHYEALPSFDFVLTHEHITLTKTPAAVATDFRIIPV